MNVKCYVPGLAASAVVVDETVDGGVDHKEEVALRNVYNFKTLTEVKLQPPCPRQNVILCFKWAARYVAWHCQSLATQRR